MQIIERWILARLRHQTFFSLAALNHAIADLLIDLNQRPFKKLPGTRRSWFESIDRPALKPLPTSAYEPATFNSANSLRLKGEKSRITSLAERFSFLGYHFAPGIAVDRHLRHDCSIIPDGTPVEELAGHPVDSTDPRAMPAGTLPCRCTPAARVHESR